MNLHLVCGRFIFVLLTPKCHKLCVKIKTMKGPALPHPIMLGWLPDIVLCIVSLCEGGLVPSKKENSRIVCSTCCVMELSLFSFPEHFQQ